MVCPEIDGEYSWRVVRLACLLYPCDATSRAPIRKRVVEIQHSHSHVPVYDITRSLVRHFECAVRIHLGERPRFHPAVVCLSIHDNAHRWSTDTQLSIRIRTLLHFLVVHTDQLRLDIHACWSDVRHTRQCVPLYRWECLQVERVRRQNRASHRSMRVREHERDRQCDSCGNQRRLG